MIITSKEFDCGMEKKNCFGCVVCVLVDLLIFASVVYSIVLVVTKIIQ
jgi:hypothetical protein